MITPSYSITATENVSPKFALDFTTASLNPSVTFSRTTNATNPATYVNSSGYVTSATNNQPRFDFNPVTLACKGLLIEESRTNYCTYSEDFTAGWSFTRSSYSSNVETSPANTLTADKLIEDLTATTTHFTLTAFLSSSSGTWTFTTYVKAAENTYAFVGITDLATGGPERRINLSTGVVDATNTGPAGSWTAISASSSNAGNGWWKVSVTATQGAGTSIAGIIYTGDTSGQRAYIGNGTNGIYVWGSQLESGAFATSYIPTTTAALTRNADVATMTGTDFSDWYNASKGTFRVDASTPASGVRPIISSDDNTANNSLTITTDGVTPKFIVTQGGSEIANVSAGTITANTEMFAYTSYDTSYFGIANPTGRQVDTSGTVPTVDRLRIGANQAGNYLNGLIQKIQFWL